ncbi:MAG: MATE family efflux transporter [Gammaproteobacteria bacterium]
MFSPATGAKVIKPEQDGAPTGTWRPQTPIWHLAAPLILANLSIALLGLVDTAVVGHLPQPFYIGAVALGAVIFDFLYWGMGFLRMGTTALVAQRLGKDNYPGLRNILLRSAIIAAVIAACILLLQLPVIHIGLSLLGGSDEVSGFARTYLLWAIWGAPAVLLNMIVTGALLGLQNGRAVLIVTVAINLLNALLDIVFVFGLQLDVRGVALATVIAQYTGTLLGLFYLRRALSQYAAGRQWRWQGRGLSRLKGYLPILSLNKDIFLRTLCLIFVFAFFTRQGAGQGDLVLAGNTILIKFLALVALGLDGFAHAAEALVGKAVGQRDRHHFQQVVYSVFFWAILLALCYALFFVLAGDGMIAVMTDIAAVREVSRTYLYWVVLSPLLSVWCFTLDGIFIGATKGVELRNAMLVSTLLVFFPVWYLLQGLGNHGLWLALMTFFVARGVTLGWYYQRF